MSSCSGAVRPAPQKTGHGAKGTPVPLAVPLKRQSGGGVSLGGEVRSRRRCFFYWMRLMAASRFCFSPLSLWESEEEKAKGAGGGPPSTAGPGFESLRRPCFLPAPCSRPFLPLGGLLPHPFPFGGPGPGPGHPRAPVAAAPPPCPEPCGEDDLVPLRK